MQPATCYFSYAVAGCLFLPIPVQAYLYCGVVSPDFPIFRSERTLYMGFYRRFDHLMMHNSLILHTQ